MATPCALYSAALWLRMALKDLPDDLRALPPTHKCTRCPAERNKGINRPRLTLRRDAPTGEPMKIPTARQLKDGQRWQRWQRR